MVWFQTYKGEKKMSREEQKTLIRNAMEALLVALVTDETDEKELINDLIKEARDYLFEAQQ